jgi:hypothetical protein
MAAFALVSIVDICGNILAGILGEPSPAPIVIADLQKEQEALLREQQLNVKEGIKSESAAKSAQDDNKRDDGKKTTMREPAGVMRRRAAAAAIAATRGSGATANISPTSADDDKDEYAGEKCGAVSSSSSEGAKLKLIVSTWGFFAKTLAVSVCLVVNLLLHLLRVLSNLNNFGGKSK